MTAARMDGDGVEKRRDRPSVAGCIHRRKVEGPPAHMAGRGRAYLPLRRAERQDGDDGGSPRNEAAGANLTWW